MDIGNILPGVLSQLKPRPEILITWDLKKAVRQAPRAESGELVTATLDLCHITLQRALAEFVAKQPWIWPLYLCGRQGRGKTRASALLWSSFPVIGQMMHSTEYSRAPEIGVNKRTRDGEPWQSIWLNCSEAIRMLLHVRFENKEARWIEAYRNAPLVVIDDLATRDLTGAQHDALLSLFNYREGKPLIVSGNFTPKELTEHQNASENGRTTPDARISSRLSAGMVVMVTGHDHRLHLGKSTKA